MRKGKPESERTPEARRAMNDAKSSSGSDLARSKIRMDSKMAKTIGRTLESLLQKGAWEPARKRIEQELKRQPDNHWLLTQLGVTFYEQGRYRESLPPLLDSLAIVPDCPLTLWNVAGALDAIGKPEIAASIYTWLLGSKKTADDDSCWESDDWTDSLKADCVYRVGVCFQHMKRWETAEHCFRKYIDLMLAGMNGTYTIEEAARHIQGRQRKGQQRPEQELREVIRTTLKDVGILSVRADPRKLPKLSLPELLAM
jgi:hypothetical protein